MTGSPDKPRPHHSSRPKGLSIRWSIFRNLLLLIILIAGGLMLTTIIGASSTIRHLSQKSIEDTANDAESELKRFFEPVARLIVTLHDYAATGVFTDQEGIEAYNRVLWPLITRFPQISSVNTGDASGHGYMLLRQNEQWRSREVSRDEHGATTRWKTWDSRQRLLEEKSEETDYDPRLRPWYQALSNVPLLESTATSPSDSVFGSEIVWTQPYTFYTTREPGITASLWARRPAGDKLAIAFDILLKDLSAFTSRLNPSPNGQAFILTQDGRVLGLPGHPIYDDQSVRARDVLQHHSKLGIPQLNEAVATWASQHKPLDEPIRFTVDEQVYWAGFRRFSLGDQYLTIGVTVPENDLLGQYHDQQTVLLVSTAAALILAILMTLFLSRAYSQPIQELVEQIHNIERLELEKPSKVQSALAEIQELADSQENMRSALASFSRYVPLELVRQLLKQGEAAQIGGRTEEITILFSDIQGFTTIAEAMEPEEITSFMAEYFEVVISELHRYQATIDKLIGDAVMALWGVPTPLENHATRAIEGALAMQVALDRANEGWQLNSRPALNTRIGLATGLATVGNIGSRRRWNYTALGDTVNLAARLEKINSYYHTRIIAAESVKVEAEDNLFVWRKLDKVAVRGKKETVTIYEVLGRRGQVSDSSLKLVYDYERALEAFLQRDFSEAADRLRSILEEYPDDQPSHHLNERSLHYRNNPPTSHWNGANEFEGL